jgi:peptide/nickel transport system permease protein
VKRNTWIDYITSAFVTVGISLPSFWLGIILVIIFSVWLKILPSSGYVPFSEDPLENLRLLILPATTLAIILAAPTMRFLRSSLLGAPARLHPHGSPQQGVGRAGCVVPPCHACNA